MSASTFLSLGALQLQATALLGTVSVPWPDEWRNVLHYLRLANLDPSRLLDSAGLPPVTFQSLYILFADLFPMVIVLLGLIAFQPAYFVLWYASMAGAIVLVGLGIGMKYGDIGESSTSTWYIIGGCVLAFITLVVGVTAYLVRHINDKDGGEDSEAVKKTQAEREAEATAFSLLRTVKYFSLCAGCFVGACALTGQIVKIPGTNQQTGVLFALGIFLFVVSALALIYFMCSLAENGRKSIAAKERFLSANALLCLLFLIDLTYVPTIDYCINSYLCAKYECPAGTVFNPRARREDSSYSTSSSIFCDPCTFRDARCEASSGWLYDSTAWMHNPFAPANVTLPTPYEAKTSYCPRFSQVQLWKFPEVSCSDPSLKYFYISSGLVLVAYVLLVPVLYFILIRRITTVIQNEVQLLPSFEGENLEYIPPTEKYIRQVRTVIPAAASLYEPFTLHHRFFSIWLLVFRLALVVLSSVLSPFEPVVALYAMLGVHCLGLVTVFYAKPFSSKLEQVFALALEGCSIVNCGYGLAVNYDVAVPGWFAYVLLVTNVVLPAVIAVATFKLVKDKNRKKAIEAHKRHVQESMSPPTSPRAGPRPDPFLLDLGPSAAGGSSGAGSGQGGGGGMVMVDAEEEMLSVPLVKTVSTIRRDTIARKGLKYVKIPPGRVLSAAEERTIHESNDRLKSGINFNTADFLTTYFACLGILFLCATGAAVFGFIKGTSADSVFPDGSTKAERGPFPVLGGYSSFLDMTSSCCCIASTNPATAFNLTERWICPGVGVSPTNRGLVPSGSTIIVVDRGRVSFDEEDNGLPIRPLCGSPASVNFGCRITVNGSSTSSGSLSVQLSCPDFSLLTNAQVSSYARQVLF